MSGPKRAGRGAALTPAVVAAAAFLTLAALASVAFVAARGGLQLPTPPPSVPPVAVASVAPPNPTGTAAATALPTAEPTSSPASSPEPTAAPSAVPSAAPTPSPAGTPDPLAVLPGCPGHPGCYEYTVRRGDSFTGVSDRFRDPLWIMAALNPEVTDTGVIVVGQTLYLGRDPTARLDLCPDGTCHLYVVRSGDTLSTIAGRYGLSPSGIEALNPGLDPSRIVTGSTIRLPLYRAF